MSLSRAVVILSLIGYAAGYFQAGFGVCDGGQCGQCSPVVYHTENSVLTSFKKLTQQLMYIQHTIQADLLSIKLPGQHISVTINAGYTVVYNKIKMITTYIFSKITQLVLEVNSQHKGDKMATIHGVLVLIQQIQASVHVSTSNLIALANEVIKQFGQANSGSTIITQVSVSVAKIRQSIIRISQNILVVVNKVDRLVKATNSISVVVNHLKSSVVVIKQSIQSFISIQNSFIHNLRSIVVLQRKDIRSINVRVKSISLKSTKIFNSLKIFKTHLVSYNSDLTQININVKHMKLAIVNSEAIIKREFIQIVNVVNRLRLAVNIVRKSKVSITSVHLQINNLYHEEIAFLQKMSVFMRYVDERVNKLRLMIKETETLLASVITKASIIRTNEENGARSLMSAIGILRSDIDKLNVQVNGQSHTAAMLTGDVNVLEQRMAVIMSYLGKLDKQCAATPVIPVGRCEHFGSCPEEPVCASDGKMYRSKCEMNKVACLLNTILRVTNLGPCIIHTTTPAPPNCGFTCEPVIKPVCASNGKTYSCYCTMKLMSCIYQLNLYVVSQGPCGGMVFPTVSSCNFYCMGGTILCGSDGVTYESNCKMLEAVCWSKTKITKKHDGRCGGKCQGGFLLIEKNCYYFHTPQKGKSRQQAIHDCAARGATIASFASDVEWKAVQQHLLKLNYGGSMFNANYWTAAQISSGNQWTWYNGKTLHFSLTYAWNNNLEPHGNGHAGCGVLSGLSVYKIILASCSASSNELYGWICIK